MTMNANNRITTISGADLHCSARRTVAAEGEAHAGMGLGGNTVAHIVQAHCPDIHDVMAGVVIEHLDAQAGTWQFSSDEGQTWRPIRTDLINRPGNMGLALDRDARLRVLPFGGRRATGARVALHTVQHHHGQGNGSYRAYASEERDGGSCTVTLVLSLSAINGAPPAVHVPRMRNKRATARRAAAAGVGVGAALPGAMAMA